MKAIDFACRLLVQLSQDELPLPAQRVLLAVAAGLDTAGDIARFTGLTANGCAGTLRSLTHKGLLQRAGGTHATYLLSAAGRGRVRQYFSFLPCREP